MTELPNAPYIGLVEALTWIASGEVRTPEQMRDEAFASLEKWKTSNGSGLLAAFEARLSGKDAGDLGKLADHLAVQMNRPLGELANELHVEMVVGARRMASINEVERLILDAALARDITLDGQPYTPTKSPDTGVAFQPIPHRHFHLNVAVNLFHGSISIAHDAPMQTYADWKGPDYANVRLSRADVLKLAALRDAKRTTRINLAFDAPHWNQHQALAWVHARSRELVAKFASNAERGTFWTEARLPGGETRLVEESAAPPSMLEITLRTMDAPKPDGRVFLDSKRELLQALSEGKVAATGLRNNTGDHTAIQATDWIDADFYDDPAVVGPSDYFRPGATKWHDVRFSRTDILRLWVDESQASPSSETDDEARTGAAQKRLALALDALSPPVTDSTAASHKRVVDWLAAKGLATVSHDTLKRRFGKK